jgi:hypothetical protein
MTGVEQGADSLRRNRGKAHCDDCLAAEMGLNRHQAQQATSGWAAAGANFSRDYDECSRRAHDRHKKVISASAFSNGQS